MDGGDRLHRIILREYRNNQLLNEAIWAQKAVDESRVPQPGPDELDKIMEKIEHGHERYALQRSDFCCISLTAYWFIDVYNCKMR